MTTNQQNPSTKDIPDNSSHFYTSNYSQGGEEETLKQINENRFKTFHNNLRHNQPGNIMYTSNQKPPKINTVVNFSTEKLLNEYMSEIKNLLIHSIIILIISILIFIRDAILVNTYKNTNTFILSLVFSTICFSFVLLYILFIFRKTMRDKYKFLYFRVYAIALVCLIIFTFSLEPLVIRALITKIKGKHLICIQLAKQNKTCEPSHKTLLFILSGVIAVFILILIKFLISLLLRSIKILKGTEKEAAQKELDLIEKEKKLKKD